MLTLNYYHLEHCNHHWLAAQPLYFPYFPELYAFVIPKCTASNAYLIAMRDFSIHLLAVACTRLVTITLPMIDLSIRTWWSLSGLIPALHLEFGWSLSAGELLLATCSTYLCLMYHSCWLWLFISPSDSCCSQLIALFHLWLQTMLLMQA